MDTVLTIRGLSKTFPGTKALDRVDFDVRRGEVHALIGQNGCGKSTLIKVLAGYHQPDPGTGIELAGKQVELRDTSASHNAGLRFVHQDLGLVETLSAVENLTLGREVATAFGGRIRWGAERRDAEQRLRALGYEFDVRRPVAELSAAERTGIAIVRALWDWEEARVLVVDEPTASLPREEVKMLFEALRRVRAKGLGVIYVSHRLDEIFAIGDRVTILRDGRGVGTWDVGDVDQDRLVSLMVGASSCARRMSAPTTAAGRSRSRSAVSAGWRSTTSISTAVAGRSSASRGSPARAAGRSCRCCSGRSRAPAASGSTARRSRPVRAARWPPASHSCRPTGAARARSSGWACARTAR